MPVAAMSSNNEPLNESTKTALHSKRITELNTDKRAGSASASAAGGENQYTNNYDKSNEQYSPSLIESLYLVFHLLLCLDFTICHDVLP